MTFDEAKQGLNPAQKKAVETIDGPVMVIAGPGTGKTQVLALRIAHILKSTDTPASGILCLTFTRSGARAMQERLESYIGTTARDVKISTFHSFGIELVEKYFTLLDFTSMPTLLTDTEAVLLVDELLEEGTWEHLRPRADPTKYFHDLKNLMSILKREGITPKQFLSDLEDEIAALSNDPASISTRGASKGELKQEVVKKIDGLNRTKEVVRFFQEYEALKRARNLMDYDDVLEYSVFLVGQYEDVRHDIQENFLYVLVDEHQDSSGVQNNFLKAVWGEVEQPNIFVVGDDRQLIYGFSGANLDYFSEFKTFFGKAQVVTLAENYRSTDPILRLADELLQSTLADGVLRSNRPETHPVTLSSFSYPRDEILGAGIYFKKLIESGVDPKTCALLLPKNHQVKTALLMLRSLGLSVTSEQHVSLLELPEALSFMRVLGILNNPTDSIMLSEALLDKTSAVPPLVAHTFIKDQKKKEEMRLGDFLSAGKADGMFGGEHPIQLFGQKLTGWIGTLSHERLPYLVSVIGNELLIDQAKNHEDLLLSIEVVRTFLHLVTTWEESHPTGTLGQFLEYVTRVSTYGNAIELAALSKDDGIHIMTLHKSKGLEYDHVWIAHMNEETFMGEKHQAFTLPENIKARIAERDVLTAKRELYVALTRAKIFCSISYASKRIDGRELTLARIIEDLPPHHFTHIESRDNEKAILNIDPKLYVAKPAPAIQTPILEDIQNFVRDRFAETRISVSMLNNFFECPWKWYFRNFLKLPEPKTVSLALGSAVHSVIEYTLKAKSLPDRVTLETLTDQFLAREGIHDPRERARLGKDALAAVMGWVESSYKTLAVDRLSERSITYRDPQFSNLIMYGKIDLTERFADGRIVVTDFKTGNSKTPGVIEKPDEEGRLSDYMRQLAMYSYLIRGAEDKHVSASRLLFLEAASIDKHALYQTEITDQEIDLLVQDIADYERLLSIGEWMSRPCHAKSYGKQTECEYCTRINSLK